MKRGGIVLLGFDGNIRRDVPVMRFERHAHHSGGRPLATSNQHTTRVRKSDASARSCAEVEERGHGVVDGGAGHASVRLSDVGNTEEGRCVVPAYINYGKRKRATYETGMHRAQKTSVQLTRGAYALDHAGAVGWEPTLPLGDPVSHDTPDGVCQDACSGAAALPRLHWR